MKTIHWIFYGVLGAVLAVPASNWGETASGDSTARPETDELVLENANPAQEATCTLTNDDQPARLTLEKTVINDNGGGAVDTDWTLTATGPDTITGVEGDASITNAPVATGTDEQA